MEYLIFSYNDIYFLQLLKKFYLSTINFHRLMKVIQGRSPFESLPQRDFPEDGEAVSVQDAVVSKRPIGRTAAPNTTTTSSGYQQLYDISGHPENLESRASKRRYERAHNDVLETVGVCTGVNNPNQSFKSQMESQRKPILDRYVVDAVVRENEIGLLVSPVDTSLLYLSSMCTNGLRHRLQASCATSRVATTCSHHF